ncbi:peroxisomal glycolate oxidase [Lineolata rhizophorae]|uniref:Oxidase FUB9 n=1 Tax=Lineolata rhizophorae TaxID=578093 RepID=A0A6A6NLQ5_9PEZI|nr:peroxisomal glycolate oxidase [Lineolata rhizophorae]
MSHKPRVLTIDDLESYANAHLPKFARDYFNGGALDSITLRANRAAYARHWIRPRVLRDVANLNLSARAFPDGHSLPFPLCVAPAAMQKMAHPEGEAATARACGAYGTVMGLSSFSMTGLEEVKREADGTRAKAGLEGGSECVLQMYLFENRSVSEGLIWRAEAAGYKAIVLTVDTPYFGRRLTEIRNEFRVPPHLRMANFDASLGVKTGSELRTEELAKTNPSNSSAKLESGQPPNKNDPSMTWNVISYLRTVTKLPIWLKGILSVEDAELAVEYGVDAIIVSNHGGRQLDCAPPTLEVLPGIAKVINGRIPVHFDGGVRRGSDIFKALCLGADMVWIGRPALWAIAYDGENGLKLALSILEDEFRSCMGLAGCSNVKQLGPEYLMPAHPDILSKL